MDSAAARRLVRFCGLATAVTISLSACVETAPPLAATGNQIIISVRDQKLTVVKDDHTRVSFPISTSKFGLGDRNRSYETPTGELAVAAKIGGGAPSGAVFHGRVTTGEVVKVDAPGRDAIVSRILALKGLEASNSKAFSRGIYIHGTPEERNIGRPTSYGCIRMRSKDVIALYEMVKVGARVQIIDTTQNQAIAANIVQPTAPPVNAAGAPPAAVAAVAATGSKPATATPAPAKKEWAGTPGALLAKQNAADAKAKNTAKPPVGAAPSAKPVSNDANADGNTPGSPGTLHRPAVDSL